MLKKREKQVFNLDKAFYYLKHITHKLHRLGLLIYSSTMLNLIISFFFISKLDIHLFGEVPKFGIALAIVFICLFSLSNLVMVVFYENYRKRGETLFEEISDEIQWRISDRQVSKYDEEVLIDYKPWLESRVILRDFVKTTDLPLIPGKYGTSIYAIINIVIAFLVTYLKT